MFQQDFWSCAWGYEMLEGEREWTCIVEEMVNVQQVIVSNESDVIEKTLHVCIFWGLQCI